MPAPARSRPNRVHYYLSRYAGSGTESDPYRPEVISAATDWSAIDLRGDASKPAGFCVAVVDTRPTPDPASAVYLGTDLDATLKASVRTAASQAVGVTLTASENTVRTITTALLTKYADADNTAKPDPLQGDSIRLGTASWEV